MQFTAGLNGAVFHSQGHKLLGGFYRAAGDSPRPTAILLHGVPGVEKNLDIAYALRDAGWNCLYFHYRGCWGSEGAYSFTGLVEDVRAATEWVVQQASVDPGRLALTGSSLGGYITLAAGAAEPRFRALAPMCPLVDPVAMPLAPEAAEEFAGMLQGVTGQQLKAQWDSLPAIQTFATALVDRPILLATGDLDELFPPAHYQPLIDSLPGLKWERYVDADHTFSACRPRLVTSIVRWLTSVC